MKKILVQEGLLAAFEAHGSIFLKPEFKVLTAKTAEEALSIFRADKADLVIVDIDMPEMGGDGLCARIREESKRGPYIILVCSEKKADLQRCESCGANTYITRPPRAEVLYREACRALDIPERKGIRVLIKVTVHGLFKKEPFFCTSKDLSISGILIETDKVLARGDEIACSFYLPDAGRVDAEGEVVRVVHESQAYNYGVRFVGLEPESETTIDTYVSMRKAAV